MTNANNEQMLNNVLAWIRQVQGNREDITATTPLISASLLDSMNLLLLISHFEEQYGITVDEKDLVPENFETPQKIATLMQKSLSLQA